MQVFWAYRLQLKTWLLAWGLLQLWLLYIPTGAPTPLLTGAVTFGGIPTGRAAKRDFGGIAPQQCDKVGEPHQRACPHQLHLLCGLNLGRG